MFESYWKAAVRNSGNLADRLAWSLIIAAALSTFAALAPRGVAAEATTETMVTVMPFNVSLPNPCTGEAVLLEGRVHTLAHLTLDPAGGLHLIAFRLHVLASGVGATSGNAYRFILQSDLGSLIFQPEQINLTAGALEFTIAGSTHILRRGSTTPDDDSYARTLVHGTVNANGELTSFAFRTETDCH